MPGCGQLRCPVVALSQALLEKAAQAAKKAQRKAHILAKYATADAARAAAQANQDDDDDDDAFAHLPPPLSEAERERERRRHERAVRSREERAVHFNLAKNEFFPGMSRASCDAPEEAIRKNPNNRPLSSRTVRNFITRGVLGSGQKGRAPPQ